MRWLCVGARGCGRAWYPQSGPLFLRLRRLHPEACRAAAAAEQPAEQPAAWGVAQALLKAHADISTIGITAIDRAAGPPQDGRPSAGDIRPANFWQGVYRAGLRTPADVVQRVCWFHDQDCRVDGADPKGGGAALRFSLAPAPEAQTRARRVVKNSRPRVTAPAFHTRLGLLLVVALAALGLALLPLKLAATALAGACFALLVLLEPAVGLYGAILSVPVQELVRLPAGLTVTQAVVALAAGAWLLRVRVHPERSMKLRFQWPWLLFLSWQLVAVVATPYSMTLGLQQVARWGAAWLTFVLTLGTITTQRRAWGLIAALLLAPGVASLIGIGQFVTASGPPSFLILGGRFARAAATFGTPNPFAGYLNMAWPLALTLTCSFCRGQRFVLAQGGRPASQAVRDAGRGLILAALFASCTAVLLLGLFASYSRGGWVGAMVALLGVAWLAGRRSAAATSSGLGLVLLAGRLGALHALPPVVADRLVAIIENVRIFDAANAPVTPANFAVVERMAHWQAAWRMWQAHPLLGIGPGSFNLAYPAFFVGRWSVSQGHAHNYYLHILAEAGPVGLAFYMLLIVAFFVQALRLRWHARGTVWEAVALGGCGIMLAVASHNVFENLHVLNLGIQLSSVWGLMVVAERFVGEHADDPVNP